LREAEPTPGSSAGSTGRRPERAPARIIGAAGSLTASQRRVWRGRAVVEAGKGWTRRTSRPANPRVPRRCGCPSVLRPDLGLDLAVFGEETFPTRSAHADADRVERSADAPRHPTVAARIPLPVLTNARSRRVRRSRSRSDGESREVGHADCVIGSR
jgi:hypothetical protein